MDDRQKRLRASSEMAKAALVAFREQREKTDKQIDNIRRAGLAGDIYSRVEAGVLTAESNRELSLAVIAATETVDLSIQDLSEQIGAFALKVDAFTVKADAGTKRLADWTRALVFATWGLAVAALTAAAMQAYAIWVAAPQIINVVRP